MSKQPKGSLIIIGGREDKDGNETILKEIATRANKRSGSLAIITAATGEPEEAAHTYRRVFKKLGVEAIDHLDIRTRVDAQDKRSIEIVKCASVVFFTG